MRIRGNISHSQEVWSDSFPHLIPSKLAFEKFNDLCRLYTFSFHQSVSNEDSSVYFLSPNNSLIGVLVDDEAYIRVNPLNHKGAAFLLKTSDSVDDLFISLISKKDGFPHVSPVTSLSCSSEWYFCNFYDLPSGDYRISFGFGVKTYEAAIHNQTTKK